MIHVSFNVAKEDILAFTMHYYDNSAVVRKQISTCQWTSAAIFGSVGIWVFHHDFGIPGVGIVFLLFSVLSAISLPKLYRRGLKDYAVKMIAEASYQKVFGTYSLVLSNEGLASTGPAGSSSIAWNVVDRAVLTPKHIFILLAGPSGFVIPRAQVSESVISEIIEFAQSQVRAARLAAALGHGITQKQSQ